MQLIQNTNDKYKQSLASVNNNTEDTEAVHVLATDEMEKAVAKCQQEYDAMVAKNGRIVSDNNNIVSLNYKMDNIKRIIEDKFVTIEETGFMNEFVEKIVTSYSICQFDLKHTKLANKSIIDCNSKHIKTGSRDGHCHATIMPDKENVHGYKSGKHCFRMYFKIRSTLRKWLFFGIYPFGVVPKDAMWGIVQDRIICNGKDDFDEKPNMEYLFWGTSKIDMLIDFDNGKISYVEVNDKKIYTLPKKFDTNISYTVHLYLGELGTEVQIAKIHVNMFGKNGKLVKWPIENYPRK